MPLYTGGVNISKSSSRQSFPIRAIIFGLRIPGRLFNHFFTYPLLDKKLANSELEIYVHDKERGLLRRINFAERLHWSLNSGKACDAVPWLDRITPLVNENDIVFDIGANTGVICNCFAHRCEAVHAFEPHPANIDTINTQITLRNMQNITEILGSGVGKVSNILKSTLGCGAGACTKNKNSHQYLPVFGTFLPFLIFQKMIRHIRNTF